MPTTWYLMITPIQEPFDVGLDGVGRQEVSFNIMVLKKPSDGFIEELVKILTTAGVGTFATNIFAGSQAVIPDNAGPYLSVVETGGPAPLKTQNVAPVPAYTRPTAQILVKATDYTAARAMARAAYNAFAAIANVNITTP